MKTILKFTSTEGLRKLAKLTLSQKKFNIAYTDESTDEKCFFLVKDQGVYLCNAFDSEDKKSPRELGTVSYAVGCNPQTDEDWFLKAQSLGGDDFAENIYLSEPMLERIANGRFVKVSLTDTAIEVQA